MSRRSLLRLGLGLAIIGALLAFSSALLGYFNHGAIHWQPLGGGLLCCLIATNAWSQLRRLP